MTTNGNKARRRPAHDSAKAVKSVVAPASCPVYLASLEASSRTSHASCSVMMMAPTLRKLVGRMCRAEAC